MDDLIAIGSASVLGLYVAAALAVAAVVFALAQVVFAVLAGDNLRAAVVLVILVSVFAAYAGTGILLQKSGYI